MADVITIHLEKLHFFANHGLYEHETNTGNAFELNVTIRFVQHNAIITHIDDTINYADVYELVKRIMQSPELLLETVITKIAEQLKAAYPQISKVQISLYKLNVPINNFQGRVGVSLERSW